MSSLRQHFQRIKEIVDWSWTLALLCLIGYLTLGQLAQLYWAMLFLGGVAGSFGLFYEFSCEKLAELDSLDTYELQKANASAAAAQVILRKFANRNPTITNYSSDFVRAKEQVNNTIQTSYTKFHEKAYQKRRSTEPKPPKPTQQIQPPIRYSPPQSSTSSNPTSPRTPQLSRASKAKLTAKEYRSISNQDDYEFVQGYIKRNGTPVNGYYRRKRRR
ncbi:hypothetical protein NIES21_41330 [Anabaenopsis circularis NIES-21]|uniref:Uncharacterized protein n=1 Tax=Anabaenopsis circularis NIES-21 TaxID=1085406 RepID=A0A1Z4GLD5_9CYAN|nr:hypothetical protein NIES21_41330 [Anabaenopsis circularis NIES-21]